MKLLADTPAAAPGATTPLAPGASHASTHRHDHEHEAHHRKRDHDCACGDCSGRGACGGKHQSGAKSGH